MFSEKTKPIKSSRNIIVGTFSRLFAMIFLVLVIVTTSTVGYRLLLTRQHDIVSLAKQMNKEDIDSIIDWNSWRENSVVDVHDVYVQITLNHGLHGEKVIYSDTAAKTLITKTDKTSLINHYYWVDDRGLYYQYLLPTNDGQILVMVGMHSAFQTLQIVVVSMLVAILLLYILAIFYIRRLADKISAPLVNFTRAVGQISLEEPIEPQLPAITAPAEVRTLRETSVSWLESLQDQVLHEKDFIANASHELKTPLAAFRGNLALIHRRGQSHPEVIPQALAHLDQEAERMQILVSQLLAMSHIEGSTSLQSDYPLTLIFDNFVAQVQSERSREIKIERQAARRVLTNQENTLYVLKILFENAVKYSPIDSPIILRLKDNFIEIVDSGLGIPVADRKKVFERFFRGDRAHSSRINGTGLGLALAAELAGKNGLTIRFFGHQPKGTIAQVSFMISHK